MTIRTLVATLALTAAAGCASVPTSSPSTRVDAAASAAMKVSGAQGLAVALIENGVPVAVRAYGARNAGGDPLTTDTVMYGASITKAVFAHLVMQLVDERRIDLDKPIAAMLPRPLPDYGNLDDYGNWGDLAGDERWRRLTPRHVLTHSTGFANFAFLEPDGKLRFHFIPGARYAYSGEGISLLQFAIEEGLGLKIEDELQRRTFRPLGMTNTSLIWQPRWRANLADGWTVDGRVVPHDDRSRVRAAGSMDTTIADLARWSAAFVRGDGLSRGTRRQMVMPQLRITAAAQFPTLAPELAPVDRFATLSAGLGVKSFSGPQGGGFFHGGHNDSTGNIWVCVERGKRCVVALSNDVRAERAYPALVRALLGETGVPWRWVYPGARSGP